MNHPIYRILKVEVVGTFSIRLEFDDKTVQIIDLSSMLEGEIYGPLRDPRLFAEVSIDPEIHTIVWPNGADFDPAILHDWPKHSKAMEAMAQRWAIAEAS